MVRVVIVSLFAIFLALMLTGCDKLLQKLIPEYDTEASSLLDDARVRFIGEASDRDMPNALELFGENVLLAMRSKPETEEGMDAFEHHIQLRTVEGELIWDYPVEQGWRCKDVLNFNDEAVFALVEKRGTEESLEEVWLLQLAGGDGHLVSEANLLHWNADFNPQSLFHLPDGQFLVHGRRFVDVDQTYEAFGYVANRAGKFVTEWNSDVSMLLPVEGGFIGAKSIPGKNPYPDLKKVGFDGETIWNIAHADTVFGGQLRGATEASDGDLIISFWDWENYRGVFAQLSSEDGTIRWTKKMNTGFLTHLYNVIPWGEDHFFLCGQKSFSNPEISVPFWESICGLIIDGDGQLVDHDARTGFWMMPVRGAFEVGNNQILLSGIGGSDFREVNPQWDIGWVVLDKTVLAFEESGEAE
jgi:hypothetical protein